jgi:hypothetical protein
MKNLIFLSLPKIDELDQVLSIPTLQELEFEDGDLSVSDPNSTLLSLKGTSACSVLKAGELLHLEHLHITHAIQIAPGSLSLCVALSNASFNS